MAVTFLRNNGTALAGFVAEILYQDGQQTAEQDSVAKANGRAIGSF
jgi:hypothetical protein